MSLSSRRVRARQLMAAAAGVALAATLVTPAAAAVPAAAFTAFAVVNGASYLGGPVPRGAHLSIFTNTAVGSGGGDFSTWPAATPDGLWVEASCRGSATIALPITGAGPSGGVTQINVYYPNADDAQACDDSGTSAVVVHPAPTKGYAAVQATIVTVPSHPGIFGVTDGTGAPVGGYADSTGGYAYGLSGCVTRPARCPVSVNGVTGMIGVYLTGSERLVCADEAECATRPLGFWLGGSAGYTEQRLLRLVRTGTLGVECAVIQLQAGTTAGFYYLEVRQNKSEVPVDRVVGFGSATTSTSAGTAHLCGS